MSEFGKFFLTRNVTLKEVSWSIVSKLQDAPVVATMSFFFFASASKMQFYLNIHILAYRVSFQYYSFFIFLITVYIQYYVVLVSGVQHCG